MGKPRRSGETAGVRRLRESRRSVCACHPSGPRDAWWAVCSDRRPGCPDGARHLLGQLSGNAGRRLGRYGGAPDGVRTVTPRTPGCLPGAYTGAALVCGADAARPLCIHNAFGEPACRGAEIPAVRGGHIVFPAGVLVLPANADIGELNTIEIPQVERGVSGAVPPVPLRRPVGTWPHAAKVTRRR